MTTLQSIAANALWQTTPTIISHRNSLMQTHTVEGNSIRSTSQPLHLHQYFKKCRWRRPLVSDTQRFLVNVNDAVPDHIYGEPPTPCIRNSPISSAKLNSDSLTMGPQGEYLWEWGSRGWSIFAGMGFTSFLEHFITLTSRTRLL